MDAESLGPYCTQLNLSKSKLDQQSGESQNKVFSNGVVFELYAFYRSVTKVADVLQTLSTDYKAVNASTLKTKLNRLLETKKKLVSKKKVKGVNSLDDLNNQLFTVGKPKQLFITPCKPGNYSLQVEENNTEDGLTSPRACETDLTNKIETTNSVENCHTHSRLSKTETKTLNTYEYELSKKKKLLNRIENQTEGAKEKLESIEQRRGHYSIRNVNKRDETARKNLNLLRDTQRQLIKQKKISNNECEKTKQLEVEIKNLKTIKFEAKECAVKDQETKKIQAQKTASYFKASASKLREKLKNDFANNEHTNNLKKQILEKNAKIQELEINMDILTEQMKEHVCETKNADGSFSDSLRMCIIELSGLEVAIEKVTSVIQTVSKQMFNCDIGTSNLPSNTTVKTIVDEGHYLAKSFISEKLRQTDNWGLNRDGTTRRKQKILDTSLTLQSGEILSLGFSKVAHETAETINTVTKTHISELADMNSRLNPDSDNQQYVKDSLAKLAFTMSDRASNEKKAVRLLDEWRDTILSRCSENQDQEVHHFHCMAHVLLGFHRYVCKDLKELESGLISENGPLGRDTLSVFKYWKTKGTVAERLIKTVSDVFGPNGDHHGLRDIWESHCAANGIKSLIGNYKDNRFNALFQTAAEICVHGPDFISVLESVKTPNLLLQAVRADLKSKPIMTVVQCLGLFYVKVTGPYWNLVTSSSVPYLELHREITEILQFLEQLEKDPKEILNCNCHWNQEDVHEIIAVPARTRLTESLSAPCENKELLFETVKKVSSAMKVTINKQLTDFLQDGKYSQQPTKQQLQRTKFAHKTNLGCEHHFGDLDSSQRRRPNASMHHHSSVQLLKRNRTQMMDWLSNLPNTDRKTIMKSARKGGKDLRIVHMQQERNVLTEIHAEMLTRKDNEKKRKAKTELANNEKHLRVCTDDSIDKHMDNIRLENEAKLRESLPKSDAVKENDYVAVAYQDGWYPGLVTNVKTNTNVVVTFMAPSKQEGCFTWPLRKDIQTVDCQFVLKRGFIPDCLNRGRLWKISQHNEISNLYDLFTEVFF